MTCTNCETWGETYDGDFAVACPKCGRKTYPNLGVNLPAGCAVAFGATNLFRVVLEVERERREGYWYHKVGSQ